MTRSPALTRRSLLIGLAALPPVADMIGPVAAWAQAAPPGDMFLRTSLVITGAETLSPEIARRIEDLLSARIALFPSRLKELDAAMQTAGGDRAAMLGALGDDQVDFALDIARPWYLGYVGEPSDTILQDDAVFTTFLEAQSFAKVLEEVPRPTYPRQAAGWWVVPPPGVTPPAMPDAMADWSFHPDGPSRIARPDRAWREYATAEYDSIEDARRAKPGSGGPEIGRVSGSGDGESEAGSSSDNGPGTGSAEGSSDSGDGGSGGSAGGDSGGGFGTGSGGGQNSQ